MFAHIKTEATRRLLLVRDAIICAFAIERRYPRILIDLIIQIRLSTLSKVTRIELYYILDIIII